MPSVRVGALVALLTALLSLLLVLPAQAQQPDSVSVLAQGGEAIAGTLRQGSTKVEGAIITVADSSGATVGETTSDADGKWSVAVPGPGAYEVTLDLNSLPSGIVLRADREPTQTVTVEAGQTKNAVFSLQAAGAEDTSRGALSRLINLSAQGVKLGAIIAMTSVGLSLIFGVTGLVNFAHGELVTFGAIVGFYLNVGGLGGGVALLLAGVLGLMGFLLLDRQRFRAWRRRNSAQGLQATVAGGLVVAVLAFGFSRLLVGGGLPLIVAAVLALVAGAVFGGGLEIGLIQPLRHRGTGLISMIVITIGLSFFIRHTFLLSSVFGSAPQRYVDYALQSDPLTLGPINMPPRDVAVILISLIVLVAVGLFLQKTKLGKAMRAVADNRDLAESSGINVERVVIAVWFMGGGLAALGGVFQALTTGAVEWDMGFVLLLLMFAGIIVGGLGTAFGAMVGGFVVGIASEVSTFWISVELKLVLAFMLLIVVLLFRPQGLLGRAERFG